METLPPEVLHCIVALIPSSSLPGLRLVSRTFNGIAFPLLFKFVPHWLDYRLSHARIVSLAEDYCHRPAVMWSPWASEPEWGVNDVWLQLVWKVLMKSSPPPHDGSAGVVTLTAHNFAELSGNAEMTENRLKTAQNRFLLYRSYTEEARRDAFLKNGQAVVKKGMEKCESGDGNGSDYDDMLERG